MGNGLTVSQNEGMARTETVEQEILRKGLAAPRVRPQDIDDAISVINYYNAGEASMALHQPASDSLKLLTLAVVVMKNGFTVVGKSACASFANFDRELGERIALDDAKRQMWPLLGYALRDRIKSLA